MTSPCHYNLVLTTSPSQTIRVMLMVSTVPLPNLSSAPISFAYQIGAAPGGRFRHARQHRHGPVYTVTPATVSGGSC